MVELTIRVEMGNNTHECRISAINKCPYCGAYNQPKRISCTSLSYSGKYIIIVVFSTSCCEKHFMSGYLYAGLNHEPQNSVIPQLVFTYPNTVSAVLPESIAALSPRFVELFNQAYTAEQNDHLDLAGAGYRNALEVLVKDYAINKAGARRDEVAKKSLYEAIQTYMPSALLSNGANIVRILGNDYTHYEKKHSQYDIDALRTFADAFIHTMNAHLLLSEIPEDLTTPKQG